MSSDFPESNLTPESSELVEAELVDVSAAEPPIFGLDQAMGSPHTNETEFSFLHPTSLVFDFIAHGKTYLVPAAFGLWGAAKGDMTLLIISAIIFIPAVLTSIFRYFTFRYCIQDDQLIVRHGLIFRNVRTVPVSRIQNIDFIQNPLHRILKVAEVKVETASGTKPEATLRVLSMVQMESLRGAVFAGKSNQPVNGSLPKLAIEGNTALVPALDGNLETVVDPQQDQIGQFSDATTLLEIPLSWLVKAGLASNRGMIMVGVALGAYYQFGERSFNFEWFRNLFNFDASYQFIVLSVILGLIVAFVLVRLLGIGWFVLRFHGYKLVLRGDDMRISCGLFTKVSATVPRQRIQFISIHRNWIMRWMNLASIRIETAGGAGKQGENATESVSKRWFVPVMPEDQIPGLLSCLRPELDWDESKLDFQPLATKTGRRLCRLAIVQATLVAIAGFLAVQPWGWAFGVAVLPLLIMWAIKKSKAMRYARTVNGVVYRSGVLNRKTSVTFFEKIQTLRVDQSPFDRRWGMARLSVDTAAAGPADHRIHVPYLDETFARQELQWLRVKTGQEQPVFG